MDTKKRLVFYVLLWLSLALYLGALYVGTQHSDHSDSWITSAIILVLGAGLILTEIHLHTFEVQCKNLQEEKREDDRRLANCNNRLHISLNAIFGSFWSEQSANTTSTHADKSELDRYQDIVCALEKAAHPPLPLERAYPPSTQRWNTPDERTRLPTRPRTDAEVAATMTEDKPPRT